MRVLITGSGAFYENFIGRLRREKHDIYTITNKNNATGKTVNYEFDLNDRKLKFVINSINPDVVLFLGAIDEQYDFSDEQTASMKYLSELSNLLVTASSLNVSRFIYLSSASVYGTLQNRKLNEDCEKNPENIKSLIVSQGEGICLEFAKFSGMKCTVLRLADMYGLITEHTDKDENYIYNTNDFFGTVFDKATQLKKEEAFFPKREKLISPLYISDAVDAVYKCLAPDKKTLEANVDNRIYNVSGNDIQLSYVYNKIRELVTGTSNTPSKTLTASEIIEFASDINKSSLNLEKFEIPEKTSKKRKKEKVKIITGNEKQENYNKQEIVLIEEELNLTVECESFKENFGFRPIINIDDGLQRMYKKLRKKIKKSEKTKNKPDKSNVLKVITPFIENILVFAVIAFIDLWTRHNVSVLFDFNFMIIYIVIIAITFGLFQSSISIILACLFSMLRNVYDGAYVLDVLIDLNTVINMLQYFIVGTICGYSKDRMRTALSEKDALLSDNQKELETIYRINEANIKIKQSLDERLANHDDSLAKIYSVIEQLNTLQPDMVFFAAVNVIMDIMRANDVTIYVITGDKFKMCRLMAKTPNPVSGKEHRNSIKLDELGELNEVVSRDEIFVNRDLREDLPMMAAPVFSDRELVSLIMIWDTEFSGLTLYNINRFLVMSRLISSVIERAYLHNESVRSTMVLPGTDILTEVAYLDILNIYKEAAEKNTTSFKTILVKSFSEETGQPLSIKELSLNLKSLLRINDYMGVNPKDYTSLNVLLTNMNEENYKFVQPRLEKAGFVIENIIV